MMKHRLESKLNQTLGFTVSYTETQLPVSSELLERSVSLTVSGKTEHSKSRAASQITLCTLHSVNSVCSAFKK